MPTKKHSALTPDAIEQARQRLASLPPAVPTSVSIRQAVKLLEPEIAALRDKGYSLPQIADHLNAAGIPVAHSTLRNYTYDPRRKRSGKNAQRSDVRKAPAPRKTKLTSPPQPAPVPVPTTETKSQKELSNPKRGPFTPKPDRKDL